MSKEITQDQKRMLEPFGNALHQLEQQVMAMTDDQLAKLEAACSAVSQTNCWAYSYHAAKVLLPMIGIERYQRRLRATPPREHEGAQS